MNWQNTIDLSVVWKDIKEDNATFKDAVKIIIRELNRLIMKYEDPATEYDLVSDLYDLLDEFECFLEDDSVDVDDFDDILNELYDLGDQPCKDGKFIWIKTF